MNLTVQLAIGSARANLLALLRRATLPPGTLSTRLDEIEAADRLSLLRMADCIGPVFKGYAWGEMWIYVLGLERCRRLAREHEDFLQPVTIDASALFPKGLLRQMKGSQHQAYRQALMQALKVASPEQDFQSISASLDRYLGRVHEKADGPSEINASVRALLAEIVFDELVRLMFGITRVDRIYEALATAYRRLGGNGLVWNIGLRQQEAFHTIRNLISPEASMPSGHEARNSVLSHLRSEGKLDDDMLGNLIYSVEMGRYDMAAFFRWLLWFAAGAADWLDKIAAEDNHKALASAFVSEALRLEQSERLVRRVQRDFVFEGQLFPKASKVRLCIWEAHKSPKAFDEPFRFDPERFIGERPGPDRYAPFGVDRHQCPFGTYSINLGAAFLKGIADRFLVNGDIRSSATRGLYHWEPAEDFVPLFSRRYQPSNLTP